MHLQLFEAALQQVRLRVRGSHLDKVGGVEGEALLIGTCQLAGKGQLLSYGREVWKVLHLVESAPRQHVAGHPVPYTRFLCDGVIDKAYRASLIILLHCVLFYMTPQDDRHLGELHPNR